ncbi:hypothetical protein CSKR_114338 [Clonorchis sinensis]|nr:hypothetical protein CSKR_114338 [Clonorchis sinensis]
MSNNSNAGEVEHATQGATEPIGLDEGHCHTEKLRLLINPRILYDYLSETYNSTSN